jgi:hypothetical protein
MACISMIVVHLTHDGLTPFSTVWSIQFSRQGLYTNQGMHEIHAPTFQYPKMETIRRF